MWNEKENNVPLPLFTSLGYFRDTNSWLMCYWQSTHVGLTIITEIFSKKNPTHKRHLLIHSFGSTQRNLTLRGCPQRNKTATTTTVRLAQSSTFKTLFKNKNLYTCTSFTTSCNWVKSPIKLTKGARQWCSRWASCRGKEHQPQWPRVLRRKKRIKKTAIKLLFAAM